MAFERYIGQRRAAFMVPKAAIWKTGQINLNRAFLEKHGIPKAGHALLFFDREKKRIGIRFTAEAKEAGAAKVAKKAGGAYIFAKGFLAHFGIEHGKARRFDVRRDDKEDLFILEPEK
jgi:hypothetical protein